MTRVNKTWDEIAIGDEAHVTRVCSADDVTSFAHAAGDGTTFSNGSSDDIAVGPGMWVGALVAGVIHGALPGPGSRHVSQSLELRGGAKTGDELTTRVSVTAKRNTDRTVELACSVSNQGGAILAEGVAVVAPPEKKLTSEDVQAAPRVQRRREQFQRLIRAVRGMEAMVTAVVFPTNDVSLRGAMVARDAGIIRPVLVGPRGAIEALAAASSLDLRDVRVVDVAKPLEAASRAVALARSGEVQALMKGNLHTDELLHAVVQPSGLRGERRISHVFVMDVPGLDETLMVTDAAINIAPSLDAKVDIVQNAIDLAHAIGIATPRVAVLSAVETINPQIPSTLDAAALSKMAERGQIRGGTVDGPLAMDNAINVEAARSKGIQSLVAGRANVLVVPGLEAGNMIAKELTFLAHADEAGLVVGATVPIMLTSRADSVDGRLASCALGVLYAWYLAHGAPRPGLDRPAA